ncbi:Na+/H+ antiporter subunit B [Roseiflexus sp.]|uniref:Na+/H+ antiporter subunit B n=1 Tax=Roseiflexus sp. TaxID=2562120 RepID=UPI0021DF20B6|nr:Na+/H+ antiporter subunit B [Roseiflexus sp.]GIW00757.1 MAG: Na(+)/H(+) antiporter subunit B [Roseiflexus sp.]
MHSLILATATRLLLPLMLIFSIFLLIRGHNEPGGGFVGGLVAGAGFTLYAAVYGVAQAQNTLRIDPKRLIGAGLLVAALSALFSLFLGLPFMTGLWYKEALPVIGKVGTPLLFDVGVYLVVIGITVTIMFTLFEVEGE